MGRLAPEEPLGADLTLVEPLGAGGMGEAWLARDRARGLVVVKVLDPASSEGAALLEREWSLAPRLDHPAIVRVLGFGRDEERAWLTLERVLGGDARRLRGGRPADVARAMLPVVDALEHAHAHGLVHRDVKASNVLLDTEGRGRLADFGIAADLASGPAAPAVRGGGSRGSLSPQQIANERPRPADDVYALGALLYDLLSGHPPFWPDFDPERVRREPPAPLDAPVPARLEQLVTAMLAKQGEERPRLAEVREVLQEIQESRLPPARIRPEVVLQPPPRPGAVIAPARPIPLAPPRSGAARPSTTPAIVLFGTLAVAAVVVFVLLPRWTASRPQPPVTEAVPKEQAAPVEPTARAASPATPAAIDDPRPSDTDREAAPAPRPASTPIMPRPVVDAPAAEVAGDAEWTRAMSDGLAALDRGQFGEAQSAFARAEAARPGTAVAADGMKRAVDGKRAEDLSLHRARGEAAEAREDWRGALLEYDAALKLEPTVAFAAEGRARSLPRAELDEMLASYLKRPARLSAEAVSREAEQALDRARDTTPSGPRLRQQTAALERLLEEARTPVDVSLLSDGKTEVVVLRVGALGTFREKKVALRPGSYVVVGRRQGYRDARKTLVVSPSRVPPPLDVRCDEAL